MVSTMITDTAQTTEQVATCPLHGTKLIFEPGGVDQATLYGRNYCPDCQDALSQL